MGPVRYTEFQTLPGPALRPIGLPLQIPPNRAGGFGTEDQVVCQTRVRYGYRRVHVLLRQEGWQVNIKKTRRIYNELGLQLRNKHPKRRVKADAR
ncbi:IS3 family transposase [Falsirhodobacter deserti]|uniref:IS3 family transposase n=1 Tax=Falsirhodobacter deserti TaxID=1365611 RepID=UPI003BAA8A1C